MLEEVDLHQSEEGLSDVSGTVNIVDASGGLATSVVLVVASTFDHTFVRGEVPPGLRAPETGEPDVTGAWEIQDVPAGDYVILAAFENDRLVRDPDESIAGTDIVTLSVEVGEEDVEVGDSFKSTEALAVEGPGTERPELVDEAPTFVWEDDSSEDYYEVEVYNAYGELVWEKRDIPGVSGENTVSLQYEGPTEEGMYYQFRATSWQDNPSKGPSAKSTTEDLRGVFYFE